MKVLIANTVVVKLILLSVLSIADSRQINKSLYKYHTNVGIPKAAFIKEREEASSVRERNQRVVGGDITDISNIPYQAGLLVLLPSDLTSVCGGSLISSTLILTAAHCYYDGIFTAEGFIVILGSNRLFSGGTRVRTTDAVVHPSWNPFTISNDIAILRISSVAFSNLIQPIALPESTETYAGYFGITSGFGITTDGGSISLFEDISSANVEIISNTQCLAAFGAWIDDTIICTSGGGGKGPCSGDSGGPLVVYNNSERILVGIVSFGAMESCVDNPTAFTRVSSYLTWIQAIKQIK